MVEFFLDDGLGLDSGPACCVSRALGFCTVLTGTFKSSSSSEADGLATGTLAAGLLAANCRQSCQAVGRRAPLSKGCDGATPVVILVIFKQPDQLRLVPVPVLVPVHLNQFALHAHLSNLGRRSTRAGGHSFKSIFPFPSRSRLLKSCLTSDSSCSSSFESRCCILVIQPSTCNLSLTAHHKTG